LLRRTAVSEPYVPEPGAEPERSTRFTESILDNLSFWTVAALVIGVLYLVWVTLEILGLYVGDIPKVGV
jgi:uncharacterized RDD family membrane protein YckC